MPRLFGREPSATWELQVNEAEATRRKAERRIYHNTFVAPLVRTFGFALLIGAALIHNVYLLGDPSLQPWLRLAAIVVAYCAGSWGLLHLFYADARKYVDVGTLLLGLDLVVWGVIIHYTGAERSWLFFIPLFRVVDQMNTRYTRTLAFAHLAPLTYATVVAHAMLVEHRTVALGPEVAKILFIYAGALYIATVARAADARQRRTSEVIRIARELIAELGTKSAALEASSREVRQALETQATLAAENADLFAATEHERVRQQQIFHSTSDGIVFVRPDGKIEAANLRAGDLLGFEPSGAIGTELSRLVSRLYAVGGGDSFVPTLNKLLGGPFTGGEGDLQQPATGRVFHWVAQPTRETSGESAGLTFTFQDVTGTRDLVRQLEDKGRLLEDAHARSEEANKAKDEFLANISHEIRTPLSAIIGMAQHLIERGEPDEMLLRIKTAADALLAIINDILDLSKIEAHKLTLEREPFALRATLDATADTLRMRASDKGLGLHVEVVPDVPDNLLGDALRLRQVLINLLGNAIKFTHRGEVKLRVGVANQLPGEVCLHFAVIDTGIGIPRDKQEVVFEPFSQADTSNTRKFGGTGLGLSISSKLVELMRGDIWVESDHGQGSAFRFTAIFGLAGAGAVVKPAAPEPLPEARRAPLTVLVVEDEEVHRELVSSLLTTRGHRVITAKNGREALTELSRHRADVALMDLQMPELDGFETTRTIRAWEGTRGGHLPIIAMTASVMGDDHDRCHAVGMDRVITKPFTREGLFRAVEELSVGSEPTEVPPELAGRHAFLAGLGGDTALARRLVDLFLEQSPRIMDDIRQAIQSADAQSLRRAAHALKGTISNFPPGPARGAAQRMEAIGFDGDLDAARQELPGLEREVERLREVLPDLVAEHTDAR